MRTCRVQWSAAAIRALPARAAIWAVNLSGNRSHEPSRERAQVRGPRSGRTLGARAPYSTGRTAAGESRGKSGTGLHPRVVYRGSVLHRTLGPVHRAVQGVGVRPPGGGVSHATEEPTPHGTHKQHARPREEVGATQRRRASEGYITEPLLTHNLPKFSLRIADACVTGSNAHSAITAVLAARRFSFSGNVGYPASSLVFFADSPILPFLRFTSSSTPFRVSFTGLRLIAHARRSPEPAPAGHAAEEGRGGLGMLSMCRELTDRSGAERTARR
jgi:hypothetical protein